MRRAAVLACLFAALSAGPTLAQPAAAPLDREQVLADVRILSADDMEGRGAGTPGGERARAYVVGRFEALGLTPPASGRLQPFNRADRRGRTVAGANVLGVIRGTRTPDRWIVVSAHYDHVGVQNGQIYNGADDNASGVATMLELARQLRAAPPEHSVLFVAFDAEERGLQGARAYVEAPAVPLAATALNLNLDMTAREDDGRLWVAGTFQHPTLRPLLEPIGPAGPVRLEFGKDTPQDTGADNWVSASDHGAFHERGVPFLYLGADYLPDYHQPTDDFERIQPDTLAGATELVIRAFRALDAGLDRSPG